MVATLMIHVAQRVALHDNNWVLFLETRKENSLDLVTL